MIKPIIILIAILTGSKIVQDLVIPTNIRNTVSFCESVRMSIFLTFLTVSLYSSYLIGQAFWLRAISSLPLNPIIILAAASINVFINLRFWAILTLS